MSSLTQIYLINGALLGGAQYGVNSYLVNDPTPAMNAAYSAIASIVADYASSMGYYDNAYLNPLQSSAPAAGLLNVAIDYAASMAGGPAFQLNPSLMRAAATVVLKFAIDTAQIAPINGTVINS